MLYYQLIERYLNSDKKVFRDEMNAYSTNEINEMVSRMCILMDKWKLEKQDIVLIVGKNSIECVVTILSCIAKGIIFAICSKDNADFAGKECSAKCRMGDEGISSLISEKKITWKEIMTIVPRRICRTQVDIKEICYILYTSGSTANPKGVVARYENVMFCIDSISSVLKYEYNDRILNCLPIYFDYGLYQILMAFWNHIELVMVNKYVIQQLPSLIGKYQITIFPVVPTMVMLMFSLNRLNVKNIKSLRMITSTGDVLPVSIINRIYSVLPDVYIVPMYGLTECKRTSVMPLNRRDKILSGSCGLPLPGTRVFLDSVDKNGIGELMICGPNVMVGYWNSPIETAERFLARGAREYLKVEIYFA